MAHYKALRERPLKPSVIASRTELFPLDWSPHTTSCGSDVNSDIPWLRSSSTKSNSLRCSGDCSASTTGVFSAGGVVGGEGGEGGLSSLSSTKLKRHIQVQDDLPAGLPGKESCSPGPSSLDIFPGDSGASSSSDLLLTSVYP